MSDAPRSLLRLGATAIATLAALCCWPGATLGQGDVRVTATTTTTSEVHSDNANGIDDDDHYGVFIERFNLGATAGRLTAQARVDGELFVDAPSDAYADSLRLERVSIRYRGETWILTAGDFYRQFGRGIALSLRKLDEAALDVSIQGGQIELKTRKHHATAFAGRVNPVNVDGITQKHVDETDDVLAGTSYTFSGSRWVKTGVFGVFSHPTQEILGERSWYGTGGAWLELPKIVDGLALYLEGDAQHRELLGQSCAAFQEDCGGFAGYASVNLSLGATAFQLEGIYLDAFEQPGSRNSALNRPFDYNQPPTLERLDQEVLNQRDVLGGHLHAEVYWDKPDLLFYGDGVLRRNDPDGPAPVDVIHAYGGIETTWQVGRSRLTASGGWRDETKDGADFKSMVHGEADLKQWLGGTWSLHLQVLHESRHQDDHDYLRGSSSAGVDWAEVGSLSVEFGYDTQNPLDEIRRHFVAGMVKAKVTADVELHLLAGTRRGGIRCVAGVCRELPPFAGAQATVVARF